MPSVSHAQLLLPLHDNTTQDDRPCKECGRISPLSDFRVKDPGTGRRSSRCRKCDDVASTAAHKKQYDADPVAIKAARCKWAHQWRQANKEKVSQINRKSKKKSRPKSRETERAYRQANPEKIREKRERYRAKHKDVIAAGHARYRQANHDLLRERHKQWRDAHPEQLRGIVNTAKHRRRARLAGAGGSHTTAEWNELKAFYDFTCLLCGRKEPEVKLTKDHVVPVSVGGANDIGNVQPLCRSCNSRKHARTLDLR